MTKRRTNRPRVASLVANLALIMAGGLGIGGTFGALDRTVRRFTGGEDTVVITPWGWGSTPVRPLTGHLPHDGLSLVVGGGLAIVTAAALLLGLDRKLPWLRVSAIAAAGLLIGSVWTIWMDVSSDLSSQTHTRQLDITITTGAGFWLLIAAAVVAIAATMLTMFAGQTRSAPDEPVTPHYGMPALSHYPAYGLAQPPGMGPRFAAEPPAPKTAPAPVVAPPESQAGIPTPPAMPVVPAPAEPTEDRDTEPAEDGS